MLGILYAVFLSPYKKLDNMLYVDRYPPHPSEYLLNSQVSKMSTFTWITVPNSMWHLLAFYLSYVFKKYMEIICSYILITLGVFIYAI
jgi:hypothetical protein